MDVMQPTEVGSARIASAIGDPARARMLFALMDGRAHTSTELALVAAVAPSTASAHLSRLKRERLVEVLVQGRHRYYSLRGPEVAQVLESLLALSGRGTAVPSSRTPHHLRLVRTCYDHVAGVVGVLLHDRMQALEWLVARGPDYGVTAKGVGALAELAIDVEVVRKARRRFAYPCLDWSERRFHLGGALAAAVLDQAFKHRWLRRERDERALAVTPLGARQLRTRFGIAPDDIVTAGHPPPRSLGPRVEHGSGPALTRHDANGRA
jgi:DNA-binding transcriptional ArsR family regulator